MIPDEERQRVLDLEYVCLGILIIINKNIILIEKLSIAQNVKYGWLNQKQLNPNPCTCRLTISQGDHFVEMVHVPYYSFVALPHRLLAISGIIFYYFYHLGMSNYCVYSVYHHTTLFTINRKIKINLHLSSLTNEC